MILRPAKYQLGQRIWVNPQETEYGPFEAVVIGVRYELSGANRYIDKEPTYIIMEKPDEFESHGTVGPTSDGWPESMLSLYPKR